jgi:hypothetical protein
VKYLEMTNEEGELRVRHRASPSPARRTARTVAVGTAGVLAVAVLGWFTAGEAGLTASAVEAPTSVSVPGPSTETDWAEPAMRRTIDIAAPPAPTERPAARPEATEVVAPPAVPRPEAPEAEAAPSPAPVRAEVPTVRQGAPCPAEGATGVTRSGNPAVCSASSGNGRTRWRHA